MATNMLSLRALLGADAFQTAYRVYGRRWTNKHPTPYDFFNTFNSVTGRDLSWFWRTWWYETWTLDQAIGTVARTPTGQLSVSVVDRGLAPMPVRLVITRGNGKVERRELPVESWLRGAREQTVVLDDAGSITKIEIDPDQDFPDVDRSNNRWTRP
jgi:aminopeptidase N